MNSNSLKEIYRHLAETCQVYLPLKELEAIKIELDELTPKLGPFKALYEIERIALVLKPKFKNPAFGAYKFDVIEKTKKAVRQLDPLTGEVIATFPSLYAASKKFTAKGGQANILKVCNGERKTAFGFKWEEK